MQSKIHRLLFALSVTMLTACCSVSQQQASARTHIPTSEWSATSGPYGSDDVLFQALELLGTPYRYGGNSPETGLDCSGLVVYVYEQALGVKLPRTSAALSKMRSAPNVSRKALKTGDLVFFATHGGRRVSHVGMYVGDGRFLHAPRTGKNVRIDRLDNSYWSRAYLSAKRVLGTELASR